MSDSSGWEELDFLDSTLISKKSQKQQKIEIIHKLARQFYNLKSIPAVYHESVHFLFNELKNIKVKGLRGNTNALQNNNTYNGGETQNNFSEHDGVPFINPEIILFKSLFGRIPIRIFFNVDGDCSIQYVFKGVSGGRKMNGLVYSVGMCIKDQCLGWSKGYAFGSFFRRVIGHLNELWEDGLFSEIMNYNSGWFIVNGELRSATQSNFHGLCFVRNELDDILKLNLGQDEKSESEKIAHRKNNVTEANSRNKNIKIDPANVKGEKNAEPLAISESIPSSPLKFLSKDPFEKYDLKILHRVPKSLKHFKDHPLFVLERILPPNIAVFPREIVGYFKGDPVFKRKLIRLSTEIELYRKGLQVKMKEKEGPLRVDPADKNFEGTKTLKKAKESVIINSYKILTNVDNVAADTKNNVDVCKPIDISNDGYADAEKPVKKDELNRTRLVKLKPYRIRDGIKYYAPWQTEDIKITGFSDGRMDYYHKNHIPTDCFYSDSQYALKIVYFLNIDFRFAGNGIFVKKCDELLFRAALSELEFQDKLDEIIGKGKRMFKLWDRLMKRSMKYLAIMKRIGD